MATRLITRLPLCQSSHLVLGKVVPAWAWGYFGCKQQCCSKPGAARLREQSFRKGIRRKTWWTLPLQGWVHSCFPLAATQFGLGVALGHRVTLCSQPTRCAVPHRHQPSEPAWVTLAPSRSRKMCAGTERWESRSVASPECDKINFKKSPGLNFPSSAEVAWD